MSCYIKKEYTLDQGKKNYLMMTADFGSLQMRLTTADTAMNPSTRNLEQPCDPGLYSIYNRNTECADAHSSTAKMVFVDSVDGKVFDFETDEGIIHLYQNFGVKVERDSVETWIEAKDIQVGDNILETTFEPLKL